MCIQKYAVAVSYQYEVLCFLYEVLCFLKDSGELRYISVLNLKTAGKCFGEHPRSRGESSARETLKNSVKPCVTSLICSGIEL